MFYLYKYHNNERDQKYFAGELLELYRAYKLDIKQHKFYPNCRDIGIDLRDPDYKYIEQDKNWNSQVTYKQLGTFLFQATRLQQKYNTEHVVLCYTYKDQKPINEELLQGFNLEYCHETIDQNVIDQMYEIGKQLSLKLEVDKVVQLRQCQIDCLDKIYATSFEDNVYGYQLACGSGKSIIIKEIINHYTDKKILVLVPTLLLLEQFKLLLPNAAYRGTYDKDDIATNRITVSVYNSVIDIDTSIYDLCIIDEAHNVFKLQKPQDFGYIEEVEEKETYITKIRDITCPKLLFSATLDEQHNIQYKYSIAQAVNDKCIVDYNLHILTGFTRLEQLCRLSGNKMLIYCKDIATCQQVSQELGCKYLSGEMNKKQRADILEDFRLNQRYLVSCRTLSEGIDLRYADSCLFYNERHSQIDVIQCIGRVMRCTQAKQVADVYVLSDDVEKSIQKYCQLLYDYSENLVDKISVLRHRTKTEECDDYEFEDITVEYQETIVKNCSQYVQNPVEFYKRLFSEFIQEFGRLPINREIFQECNIGIKLYSIKKQDCPQNKELYQWLDTNYHDLLLKSKNINPTLNLHQWKQLFTEFINEYGRLPKTYEQYKGYDLGCKLSNIRQQNTQQMKELYQWLDTNYHNLFQQKKQRKTIEQTKQLFTEFINEYGRLPISNEQYKGHNLGSNIYRIKYQTTNETKELYQWLDTNYHDLIQNTKTLIIKTQSLSFKQWKQLLTDFINEFNRLPKYNEQYKEYNIGRKFNRIKYQTNATQSDKELYQFLSTSYPHLFTNTLFDTQVSTTVDTQVEETPQTSNLTTMTVNQLKQYCRDNNIKGFSKYTKKADLIEYIQNYNTK